MIETGFGVLFAVLSIASYCISGSYYMRAKKARAEEDMGEFAINKLLETGSEGCAIGWAILAVLVLK